MTDPPEFPPRQLIVVGDRVLITPEEGDDRVRGGLYLPATAVDSQQVQGGLIVADNTLWSGRVLKPQSASDKAIVAFNEMVAKDARVEKVLLTVRDGMTLAWKR